MRRVTHTPTHTRTHTHTHTPIHTHPYTHTHPCTHTHTHKHAFLLSIHNAWQHLPYSLLHHHYLLLLPLLLPPLFLPPLFLLPLRLRPLLLPLPPPLLLPFYLIPLLLFFLNQAMYCPLRHQHLYFCASFICISLLASPVCNPMLPSATTLHLFLHSLSFPILSLILTLSSFSVIV